MIEDLHHIGIAVRSLDEALPHYRDVLGLELRSIEEVPTERVRVAVLMAGPTRIELLEPTADDCPVAVFLHKRGPGVHHLAFRVDDAAAALSALQQQGAPLLGAEPRPGAHGTKVVFVHPRWLGGVLVELVEEPR